MKIKRFTLVSLAIAVAAMVIVILSAFAGSLSTPLQSKPSVAQKWEYCAVSDVRREPSSRRGEQGPIVATVIYLLETGESREKITMPDGKDWDSLAKAFSKLGQDGWELVFEGGENLGGVGYTKAFYFKRPKG